MGGCGGGNGGIVPDKSSSFFCCFLDYINVLLKDKYFVILKASESGNYNGALSYAIKEIKTRITTVQYLLWTNL